MKKINFVFGIHCHQPVGNFDFVFDDAYHKSYQPFLDIVEKYPDFKLNVHYTGILLEWIKEHYPAHIDQLNKMGKNGQVEHMSGGFYEPILAVIPEEDAIGQIQKQSKWIAEEFDAEPRGMWLAERVWEPTLPSILHKADMEYTVIDDVHFKYSGLHNEDLLGYYITEDRGRPVKIFPISQKLRYTIPFQDPQVTIDYFKELASEDEEILMVFADDGEKFGVWPGTYDSVYKKGWLDSFFKLVVENKEWINMMHFSEVLEKLKPMGRVYLPTASYAEMMQWSLPSKSFSEYENFEHYLKDQEVFDQYGVFVRGGFWRNFQAKYSESNHMHKKMMYISQKALAMDKADEIKSAQNHIWAGQCNCPYWHGVFGGLYLGHIRHAIYEELIRGEKALRAINDRSFEPTLLETDYNLDGVNEVIVETETANYYFEPEAGGRLTEFDYLPKNFNLMNTMTRREEGYHHKLVELAEKQVDPEAHSDNEEVASIHDLVLTKEEGLEKHLNYDKYERKSLVEHFLSSEETVEAFQAAKHTELANFHLLPFFIADKAVTSAGVTLKMSAEGIVKSDDGDTAIRLTKLIRMDGQQAVMDVEYLLENLDDNKVDLNFAVEFNFSLLAGYADDRYYMVDGEKTNPPNLASMGKNENADNISLVDEWVDLKLDLQSDKPAEIWRCPVETISLSESGFERVYQNSTVIFKFPIELKDKWRVKISKKVSAYSLQS